MKALRSLSILLIAALLATTISTALPTQTVYAATITVDSVDDTRDDDGKCTLREAILNANNDSQVGSTDCLAGNGDDIITFNLSYPATITLTSTSGDLRIIKDLTITGPGAAQLTIDGNNAGRIFDIGGLLTAEISGLTIANGLASDGDDTSESDGDKGGGIYNNASDLTLTDVTVKNNTASEMGGGIYNDTYTNPTFTDVTFDGNIANADDGSESGKSGGGGMYNDEYSSPTLSNVTFENNTTNNNGKGGGMFNYRSSPDLTDVTFSGNTALNGNGGGMFNNIDSHPTLNHVTFSGNITDNGDGGGMYNTNGSTPTLTNVTFSSNKADNGGGMYNMDCSPTLTNVTFSNNTADGYEGGGMYNAYGMIRDASPTLTNVTFSGNTAARSGGGMHNAPNSSPTLTNVTFSGNTASSNTETTSGGGMYNLGGNPDLTNVTFSSNTADNGGGMYNDTVDPFSCIPTLTNVTFSGNTADDGSGGGNGGGMYNASNCSPTLENVILWGDSALSSGNEMFNYDSTTTPTITDSVVAGGCPPTGSPTCTNIITTNPELSTLADNGGPTQTIALGVGSSALDAGGANTTCASTDQRGAARPYGISCDIGAYEGRESITVGTCGGSVLNGPQTFNFTASANTVTVDVDTGDGISCITIEEMGPGESHTMAAGPGANGVALQTNNWWHITGDVTSGFSVDVTLPYSSPDTYSRVCRWPGSMGGHGWDCDDGTNTSFGTGTVTRTGVDRFSDWAVGDNVGPTAVSLFTFTGRSSGYSLTALASMTGLFFILIVGFVLVLKKRRM
jgi:CSLREA domain-containing protein